MDSEARTIALLCLMMADPNVATWCVCVCVCVRVCVCVCLIVYMHMYT